MSQRALTPLSGNRPRCWFRPQDRLPNVWTVQQSISFSLQVEAFSAGGCKQRTNTAVFWRPTELLNDSSSGAALLQSRMRNNDQRKYGMFMGLFCCFRKCLFFFWTGPYFDTHTHCEHSGCDLMTRLWRVNTTSCRLLLYITTAVHFGLKQQYFHGWVCTKPIKYLKM